MKLSGMLGLVGGLALSVVAATALPAHARPLENGHEHESFSEVLEDFCGISEVLFEHEGDFHFSAKSRGPEGLIHFASNSRFTDSWTNLATGKTFTREATLNDRDQRITDNGDGTLTILVTSTGNEKFYGADGKRLFVNAGLFSFAILIDHGGTPTDPSDDEFLEDLGAVKEKGRTDTAGRDFCADLVQFTG